MIARRERPHPGAQLSFCDHDGHRFLATLTDLPGDPVELECQHRARASAEDRVRTGKSALPTPAHTAARLAALPPPAR